MRPSDTLTFVVGRSTAAGAASTGKVLSDFTIQAYKDGVSVVVTPTVTELATVGTWRDYRVSFTLPASGPYVLCVAIVAASGTDIIRGGALSFEVEQHDFDSVAALSIRTVAVQSAATKLPDPVELAVIAYRSTAITVQVTDQAGNAINWTGYTNLRFSAWDRTHAGTRYTLSSGITADASGNISFTLPEGASFYSAIDAAITLGQDEVTWYYDVVGDAAGLATDSRTMLRGTLRVIRFESAA